MKKFLFLFALFLKSFCLMKKDGSRMGSLIWRQVNSVKPLEVQSKESSLPEELDTNLSMQPKMSSEKKESIVETQKKALEDLKELKALIDSKKEGGFFFILTLVLTFLNSHSKSRKLSNTEIDEMSHVMVYEKTIKQKVL